MAADYDFTIDQGTSFSLPFEYLEGASPGDLTGAKIQAQLRSSARSPTKVADWNTLNGKFVIDIDPMTGKFHLGLTPADTRALPAGIFVYDIELERVDGTVTRLLQGRVKISAEVTRDDPIPPPP